MTIALVAKLELTLVDAAAVFGAWSIGAIAGRSMKPRRHDVQT